MRLKSLLILIMLATPFFLAGCKGKNNTAAEEKAAADDIGQVIPFKVKTFRGGEFSLDAMKGRPVVINFFASWCGPCRIEAKGLERTYMAFKDRGVEFIGVAVDDSEEGARGFVKHYGLTFPSGRDITGEIMKAYQLYGIPKTLILGKDGKFKYSHTGAVSEGELASEITKTL